MAVDENGGNATELGLSHHTRKHQTVREVLVRVVSAESGAQAEDYI